MVLYFSNRLPLSIRKGINLLLLFLKLLTNPLVLSNIKTNGLITSSKYPINYLEPFFVSISFEITILSTEEPKFLVVSLHHKILLFLLFPCQTSAFCCLYLLANLHKHSSKKTCAEYLLPSLKTNRTTITML